MTRRWLIFLGLVVLLPETDLDAQARPVGLTGEVVDASNRPVPLSVVTIDPVGWVAQSDSQGMFAFAGLEPGAYSVSFTAAGFAPRVFQFEIPDGHAEPVDFGPVVLYRGVTRPVKLIGQAVSLVDRAPVASATVTLNDEVIATTDSDGRFETTVPLTEFTATSLSVRRVGFVPGGSRIWLSSLDSTLRLTLPLEPLPVMLEEIVISAERTVLAPPHMRGFFEREHLGGGSFISSDDIEKLRPFQTTDLLRRVPGILITERVLGDGFDFPGKVIKTLRGGGRCQGVLIYIDGARVASVFLDDIDRLVDPRRLAGVEVYTGAAQIPVIFNPTGSACGVIVFWLK